MTSKGGFVSFPFPLSHNPCPQSLSLSHQATVFVFLSVFLWIGIVLFLIALSILTDQAQVAWDVVLASLREIMCIGLIFAIYYVSRRPSRDSKPSSAKQQKNSFPDANTVVSQETIN